MAGTASNTADAGTTATVDTGADASLATDQSADETQDAGVAGGVADTDVGGVAQNDGQNDGQTHGQTGDESARGGAGLSDELLDRLNGFLDSLGGGGQPGDSVGAAGAGQQAQGTQTQTQGAAQGGKADAGKGQDGSATQAPEIAKVVDATLKAADEFMGDGAGERVLKPLTDVITALQTQVKQLEAQLRPVTQYTTQAQAAAKAEATRKAEDVARKFFDANAAAYGGKFDDIRKDPAKAQKAAALFNAAANLQQLYAQQGQPLGDDEAMNLAHAALTRKETVSQARQRVLADARARTSQRTVPARSASTAKPPAKEPETLDEITANARKFWPKTE